MTLHRRTLLAGDRKPRLRQLEAFYGSPVDLIADRDQGRTAFLPG
jgi:hypothetical protein